MSERNKRLFKETANLCLTNPKLLQRINISRYNQSYINENAILDLGLTCTYYNEATVIVSKNKTIQAARGYYDYKRVAVLNFASFKNPGGGVENGANAQEESLCMCSTLYDCISTDSMMSKFYYPHRNSKDKLYNNDIIYTPDVTVIRDDVDYKLLDERDWFHVDVLTCAAPNYGCVKNQVSHNELMDILVNRMRRIFSIAHRYRVEVLILGAWGCGVFGNPPEVVAQAFDMVIKEFKQSFKVIEFAVYCGKDETNFNVFDKYIEHV